VKKFEKYIKQPKPSWIYCLSLMAVILIFVIKYIFYYLILKFTSI